MAFAPLDQVLAIGTAQGVVKRVQPDYPLNREDWEVIALKDKDTVVGVAPAGSDDDDLVFITRQAQLLRFSASAVRPQGRTAGGMAGIKLAAGDRVMFFGTASTADAAAVVVTIAGTDGALPGTAPRRCEGHRTGRIPVKGRATGGVRAHRFLKGEDTLLLGWAGHGPAKASSLAGVARSLPGEHGRRDGSGIPLSQAIDAIGPSMAWSEEPKRRHRRIAAPWRHKARPALLSRSGPGFVFGAARAPAGWNLGHVVKAQDIAFGVQEPRRRAPIRKRGDAVLGF